MVETGKLKMGSSLSKKKKRQGLVTQAKALVGDESPPSSPRNLGSILSNPLLLSQFQAFLASLDVADADSEESGRVASLQYVFAIRELESLPESERMEEVGRIGCKYFQAPGEGLNLDNSQLWIRCSEVCRSQDIGPEDMRWLLKARDAALRELDDLHVVFLAHRAPSQLNQIINCIL